MSISLESSLLQQYGLSREEEQTRQAAIQWLSDACLYASNLIGDDEERLTYDCDILCTGVDERGAKLGKEEFMCKAIRYGALQDERIATDTNPHGQGDPLDCQVDEIFNY